MASFQNHHIFPLLFFFFLISISLPLSLSSSIHDLLKSKGLPGGLFPKDIKSFTLYETGLLEVNLEGPCLAKFDTMAFYESVIKANLTYGGLTGVQGMSQEELFLWLPVKDIIVDDPESGLILFDIGVAHKQLSFSLFEDPPDCKPQVAEPEMIGVGEAKNWEQRKDEWGWIEFSTVPKDVLRSKGRKESAAQR